jgi:predicted O-linked N-acetylglucosamine transferase (SPINDLY family)
MRRIPDAEDAAVEPAAAFRAFHLPLSGAERHAVARKLAADIEARAPAFTARQATRPGRIRLGVLSPDLKEHLNGHLLLPLFQLLDRERFELHAYSLSPDDDSDIRRQLVASAERFTDLHALGDGEAAATIQRDDIDILIDAGGHTSGGRFGITARRPGRVQCIYLGFAGSLASTRVDFAITDRIVASDAAEWSEICVDLPHTYYLYDFRVPPPAIGLTRREYGLPEKAFIYCAFHKAEKISPDTFLLWTRILRLVPSSVLWLLALPEAAQRNLRREAVAHGIDPARLHFAPYDSRDRYLARQRLGGLLLDAVHHSAMTTACDAFAVGLPMLALRGAAMAARAGESLLRAAGLPELVCFDKEAFVAEAVRLASDLPRLETYRQRLEARDAPLFDTSGRVRELENAFLEMLQQSDLRPVGL